MYEPPGSQVKHTTYIQQHKLCAVAAMFTSSCYYVDQQTVIKADQNALAKFLDTLIVWKA